MRSLSLVAAMAYALVAMFVPQPGPKPKPIDWLPDFIRQEQQQEPQAQAQAQELEPEPDFVPNAQFSEILERLNELQAQPVASYPSYDDAEVITLLRNMQETQLTADQVRQILREELPGPVSLPPPLPAQASIEGFSLAPGEILMSVGPAMTTTTRSSPARAVLFPRLQQRVQASQCYTDQYGNRVCPQ